MTAAIGILGYLLIGAIFGVGAAKWLPPYGSIEPFEVGMTFFLFLFFWPILVPVFIVGIVLYKICEFVGNLINRV